jgi:outer membrane receptor for ferric coprogen and ferric-rhodotorulic acid
MVQILFDESMVKGLKAPAVRGRSTAQAALDQLLRDTGLTAVASRPGTFTVQRAKQSLAQQSLAQSSTDKPTAAPKEEPKTFTLPPVTVTAPVENTMRAEMERDLKQTKSVTGVSGQELQDFNPVNAFDALRVVPGVNYLFGSGTRNATPATIRGAAGTPTPKIIDDFPSIKLSGTGADRANTGFSNPGISIPSIAIESVEVVRGSQGVLYG